MRFLTEYESMKMGLEDYGDFIVLVIYINLVYNKSLNGKIILQNQYYIIILYICKIIFKEYCS